MTSTGLRSTSRAQRYEQVVAVLAAAACWILCWKLWASLAAYQDVWLFPALYFIELTALTVVCAAGYLLRVPSRAKIAWGAGGALMAFAVLGAWTVGLYFLPLAVVLLVLGVGTDRREGRNTLAHLGVAGIACLGQAALILLIARMF